MNYLNLKALAGSLALLVITAGVLFVAAGTLDYWQVWVFLASFFGSAFAITVYLMITDPRLLERRISAGPLNEKETSQKVIQSFAQASFLLVIILPALDYRFGWSAVPAHMSILGDVLIVIGFYMVFKENTHASALVEVEAGQKVVSTGPYALVRHPMYSGALVLLVGMPLALGSYWGVLTIIPIAAVILWRLLDEERFLAKNLPGYAEYETEVKHRLVPFGW